LHTTLIQSVKLWPAALIKKASELVT